MLAKEIQETENYELQPQRFWQPGDKVPPPLTAGLDWIVTGHASHSKFDGITECELV